MFQDNFKYVLCKIYWNHLRTYSVDQFWKKNTNQPRHSTNNHKNKTTEILIILLKRNPKPQPQKGTNTKLKDLKIKKQKKILQ